MIAHLSRGVSDTRISAASVSTYVSDHSLKKERMVGIFVQEVSGGSHITHGATPLKAVRPLETCLYHDFRSVKGVLALKGSCSS